MRIAYLSIDEVNQYLAFRMAEERRAALQVHFPVDPVPDGEFEAVLCDLDYWPGQSGEAVVERLLANPHRRRVAVHSYHLTKEQARALRDRGVGVFRTLEPEVLRWLADGSSDRSAAGILADSATPECAAL